jgi:hypothetical protein
MKKHLGFAFILFGSCNNATRDGAQQKPDTVVLKRDSGKGMPDSVLVKDTSNKKPVQ